MKNPSTLLRVLLIVSLHLSVITLFAQERENREERILDFRSDIVIESTGRVQVTEHIKVFANGSAIKRGIVRRIPFYREDVNGKKIKIDIKVLSVERDGEPEAYHEDKEDGSRVIYVGSKDHILDPGQYAYAITYESYGHVGFFDDFDELYWNVTGNEWDFMIEAASATVRLPDGSRAINMSCYTGYDGDTSQNCTCSSTDDVASFESNGVLFKGEGLTVAVSFPRDIVKRPPPPGMAELLLQKLKKEGFIIISLLAIGIFYFRTWRKVGKDPETPVVIPSFDPPNGWSPAVVRYLYKKKYDEKAFTTAILSMAIKGAVVISKVGKTYSLGKTKNTPQLSEEEQSIYNALFSRRANLQVTNKSHSYFASAFRKLRDYLTTKWDMKEFFRKNSKYTVSAALLTFFIALVYALLNDFAVLLIFLFLSGFGFAGLFIMTLGIKADSYFAKVFLFLFGLCFALPSFTTGVTMIITADLVSGLFVILLFGGFIAYMYLIKAPTELGAQTQAELAGFKMYLETVEKNRLPKDLTPELFETMLPYAVALGIESKWTKKFTKVLAQYDYSPEWYGDDRGAFNPSIFTSSLSTSLASAFSRAQFDPSSSSSSSSGSSSWSSGSSGGGRSGGGGGGGGGGGW